jgi:hypothetical protein
MISVCGVLGVAAAMAQDSEPAATVKLKYTAADHAEVDDQDAAYGVQSVGFDVEGGPLDGGLSVSFFDWRDPETFVEHTGGNDPWGTLYSLRLGLHHQGVLTENLMVDVMGGVSSGFEKQADDSFAGYLGGYGILQLSPRAALLLGIFYSRHQEIATDFDLVPIIGLTWNRETTEGFSFMLGLPETRASWHFSERYRLVFDIRSIEGGVYRLADDNAARPGGYLELVSASANLWFEAGEVYGFDLAVGAGHTFHREVKLYDRDGGNECKYDVEQAPVFSLALSRSF